jgi:hypothetical protein
MIAQVRKSFVGMRFRAASIDNKSHFAPVAPAGKYAIKAYQKNKRQAAESGKI